jgi:uncharacterized protein YcaQ
VLGVLHRLGAVQLDTISVLARSHELVPYSRLGAVGRAAVERAFWGQPPRAFEYWSHAACLLPMESWPLFAFRRRRSRARYGSDLAAEGAEVLARLADGPLTATDLGGARRGGPWWDWSPLKRAAERLLAMGRIVSIERRGWRRVYDLAERAIPAALREEEPTDAECARRLVARAGAALGVATVADLAEHHRTRSADVRGALPESGLIAVTVEGWPAPAWADPAGLAALAEGEAGRPRTTLLSPFDSLIWDRARTERLFGFTHRLEAYVPRPQRVHGYFAMPLLAGGQLVGRVDPSRSGTTLVARQVSLRRGAVRSMARALRDAARWVGCSAVAVERVDPPNLAGPLRAALAP